MNSLSYKSSNKGAMNWFLYSQVVDIGQVYKHPLLPWNRHGLSNNKGISLAVMSDIDRITQCVGAEIKEEWIWINILDNAPLSDIMDNPTLPWQFHWLQRKDVGLDFIRQYHDMIHDDWLLRMGFSSNLPVEQIMLCDPNQPALEWYRQIISANPTITRRAMVEIDTLHEQGRLILQGEWDWKYLSRYLPVDDILAYPDLPWKWRRLSRRVPIDFILQHPRLGPWDRGALSSHPQITVRLLNKLSSVITTGKWNRCALSQTLPIDDLFGFSFRWSRSFLSNNTKITFATMNRIDQHPRRVTGLWSWVDLSQTLPVDDILSHPDCPWDITKLLDRSPDDVNRLLDPVLNLISKSSEPIGRMNSIWYKISTLLYPRRLYHPSYHPTVISWDYFGLSCINMTVDDLYRLTILPRPPPQPIDLMSSRNRSLADITIRL
jgi:hypothetical protein